MNKRIIIDAHVHLFPDRLFEAIWKWFDDYAWQIKYKMFAEQAIAFLADQGVGRFTALNYAHKPGIAATLNNWTHELAIRHPEIIPFGTVHPEDEDIAAILDRALGEYNFAGIKLHCHVMAISPDDERLFPIYEKMIGFDKPLIIHAGAGPSLGGYSSLTKQISGVDKIARMCSRFPSMKVLVPHCGADEFPEFFDLMDRFPNLWTDNTMAFSGFFEQTPDPAVLTRFGDRILFGSDFPNIPYDYRTEIEAIEGFGLSKQTEEMIFSGNAMRLFGL